MFLEKRLVRSYDLTHVSRNYGCSDVHTFVDDYTQSGRFIER